jgi:hypothetical protein
VSRLIGDGAGVPLTDAQLHAVLASVEPGSHPDVAIVAIAQRQDGAVATRQLLLAGVTSGGIGRRIATGRLHPMLRGTHAVGRPADRRRTWWQAALLLGGPDAPR